MNTRITAKEYRGYVERGEGIPALMPKPSTKAAKPAKGKRKAPVGTKRTGRTGKYNARGRSVDGIWMASEAQAQRFEQLRALEQIGAIRNLKAEVPFPLVFNGVKICIYRADFQYVVVADRSEYVVIEDVKGMLLPEYLLKKKLMLANSTPIFEIPAKDVPQWHNKVPSPPT